VTEACAYIAGLFAGIKAHTGIALAFGKVKVPGQRTDAVELAGHVGQLGAYLLHPHTICVHRLRPLDETLVGGRTDAVQVE